MFVKKPLVWGALFSLTAVGVFAAVSMDTIDTLPELKVSKGNRANGAYLARASGCIACHTDFENGGKPLAGGPAIETDFGTFYASNLTTDKTHGIGDWSLEQFAKALREGVSPETGEPYYPAFPYTFYANFSDQDVADLWAAFKTVPPVSVESQKQELSFPFNVRSGLYVWQSMFFDRALYESTLTDSDSHNRGGFLVEVAGHCAACHTQRNILGGLNSDQWLEGASGLPDGGSAPAITAKKLLADGWNTSDLAYALKTGIKPDGDVLGAGMGEVIRFGTSYLNREDRTAIADYLLEIKP